MRIGKHGDFNMNLEHTISEISALSVSDRLRVVQAVWDSLPMDTPIELTEEQSEEIKRRITAHQADPSTSLSREELERRLGNDG